MKAVFITIFPNTVKSVLSEGIFRIAKEKGLFETEVINLRDYTENNHKTVDDRPFGGGPGMVLMCEPVFKAVEDALCKKNITKRLIPSPAGRQLNHKYSEELSKEEDILIFAPHYEGYDDRIREYFNFEEVSVGPYVVSGGELPGLVILDSAVRLIKGVLGGEESLDFESHKDGLLEYPQWTRPSDFKGMKVPEVLLSGNHKKINKWRLEQAVEKTRKIKELEGECYE